VFVEGEKEGVEYLDRLGATVRDGRATRRHAEDLFGHFLGATDAPAPDPLIRRYFYDTAILLELAEVLHGRWRGAGPFC
jgi:hypothetical protein